MFATDLQYALNYEGRDLTDDEAYRHLLAKYSLDEAVTEFLCNFFYYRAEAVAPTAICVVTIVYHVILLHVQTYGQMTMLTCDFGKN